MKRKRTIYFDDARHYYLYSFDPPITMEQAWTPIDQVAGTGVDTFIYGVACGGMFYPSKIAPQFCERSRPFTAEYSAAFWRAWTNMQSLIARGLDPLKVLVDRAHEQEMEFLASLRMGAGGQDGFDPSLCISNGGRGFAHPEVRDHFLALLRELAEDYEIEGVELDFTAAPAALERLFREEEAVECTPLMNEYIGQIAEMARSGGRLVGARIYPTEQMNLNAGLDVRSWLKEGWVDYVTPVFYATLLVDPDMPIDWVVEAAREHDTSVYGFLQPDFRDENRRFHVRQHATPEMLRAAASNFIDRGVDGLYTWFLPWPLGSTERSLLMELADHRRLREGDKHYYLRRQDPVAEKAGYDAALPLSIPGDALGTLHRIPFYVSDDIQSESAGPCQVVLRINIFDLVTADQLTIRLNGASLADELCYRSPSSRLEPYYGQWLEFHLASVFPKKGENVIEISLDSRPPELEAAIRVEDVELIIRYGLYPSGLAPSNRS